MHLLMERIVDELNIEMSASDPNFNKELLRIKVTDAFRDVMQALGYKGYETDKKVAQELEHYTSNIKNIARYDYNMIGGEYTSAITESSTSRQFIDRNKLFAGIYPESRF